MDQLTLPRFVGGLGCKIYGSNKTGPNWSNLFWLVAHVGLFNLFK